MNEEVVRAAQIEFLEKLQAYEEQDRKRAVGDARRSVVFDLKGFSRLALRQAWCELDLLALECPFCHQETIFSNDLPQRCICGAVFWTNGHVYKENKEEL